MDDFVEIKAEAKVYDDEDWLEDDENPKKLKEALRAVLNVNKFINNF